MSLFDNDCQNKLLHNLLAALKCGNKKNPNVFDGKDLKSLYQQMRHNSRFVLGLLCCLECFISINSQCLYYHEPYLNVFY